MVIICLHVFFLSEAIMICLYRYRIRGDDEEWDQVLKKAGNTAIVSIKRYSCIQNLRKYCVLVAETCL